MKRIAVLGAGAMGSGIGQVAAMAGHEVILYDTRADAKVQARDSILQSLNKLAGKSIITDQDAKAIFGRIYFADALDTIANTDLVIEAVIEDEKIKKELLRSAETLIDEKAIIATNTSSLSVTGLAADLKHPDRFIGIHFFNPPVLMKLVEVTPALQTSHEVLEVVKDLIGTWNKTVVIAKDTPGFIVNRIARPYYSEALRIAEEGIASPSEIDHAMKTLGGFKMGPFELMDFIGHDINEAVTRSVWTAMHYEPRYKPSHLQASLVKAGWLGRKTGRGFYHYVNGQLQLENDLKISADKLQKVFDRIIVMLINEAADSYYLGVGIKG